MPKITVYVPDEMKARMDKAEKSANWSALAQRAFESELNHIERVKEVGSMSDVIERLQASKAAIAKGQEEQGRQSGVEWAKRWAEYDQLKRAAEMDPPGGSDHLSGGMVVAELPDPGIHIADAVRTYVTEGPDAGYASTSDELAEFFDVEVDMINEVLTEEYVGAWLKGASDVWDEVADKI